LYLEAVRLEFACRGEKREEVREERRANEEAGREVGYTTSLIA
jgi:hypothetical protein